MFMACLLLVAAGRAGHFIGDQEATVYEYAKMNSF
jgi:hypothetical protein